MRNYVEGGGQASKQPQPRNCGRTPAVIHFYKESPATRSAVLRVIASYDIHTTVFTSFAPERDARPACILAMSDHIAERNIVLLTFEIDESFRHRDEQAIQPIATTVRSRLTWRHLHASAEPGLWIPDAIGWCLNHPEQRWRDAASDLPIARVTVR